MLVIAQASKSYGQLTAYKNINLHVPAGQMFGLIGPDGAGKTSLIRGVVTMLAPDAGTITIGGYNTAQRPRQVIEQLGYMPQRFSLYQDLTVQQNLDFFAGIFGITASQRKQRLGQLYQFSRLGPFKNRRAGSLSGGMKQKLALMCNLIHRPRLLVLDEPTFGVDPVSREDFWQLLNQIRVDGTTIFTSTPYMDEAERFEQIAFMFKGQIIATGTPGAVKATYPYPLYRVDSNDIRKLHNWLQQQQQVVNIQMFGDCLHVALNGKLQPNQQQQWLNSGYISQLTPINAGVEDVFLWRMGQANE